MWLEPKTIVALIEVGEGIIVQTVCLSYQNIIEADDGSGWYSIPAQHSHAASFNT